MKAKLAALLIVALPAAAAATPARECMKDEHCVEICEARIKPFNGSLRGDPFDMSRCEFEGEGTRCVCGQPQSGYWGPRGFNLSPASATDGCLFAAPDKECLLRSSEFSGCDTAAPESSCEPICDELHRRIVAKLVEEEIKLVPKTTLHGAVCDDYRCGCVYESERVCFAEFRHLTSSCDKSAAAIWEEWNPDRDIGCAMAPGGSFPFLALLLLALLLCARARRC